MPLWAAKQTLEEGRVVLEEAFFISPKLGAVLAVVPIKSPPHPRYD